MADNKFPEGWGSQKNNIKPWTKAQNDSSTKPLTQPKTKNKPLTDDLAQEENEIINPDKGEKTPVVSEDETPKENLQTEKTKPKTIRKSTVILSILLTTATCFLAFFAFLYYSGKNNNETNRTIEVSTDNTVGFMKTTTETTATPTETVTEEPTTEPSTTPKPTAEPTTANPTEEQPADSFKSYLVWLNVGEIVYEKPYPRSGMTYAIEEATYYTIVDQTYDEFGNLWGKLKSGIGWVYLSRTYQENKQPSQPFNSYLIRLSEGVNVYEQPSPNSNITYIIDITTDYTIVDEAYDEYGDVWGKLKSGVGWVNLSQLI